METEKSTKKKIDSGIREDRIVLRRMTQEIHLLSVFCAKEHLGRVQKKQISTITV